MLFKTEYFKRHDAMMRVIYCYLLQKLGFVEELVEWYRSDYVEKFKENDTCKLYWDFAFHTERSVEYNRPDTAVILKETKEMIIIEGSTPGDMNLTPRTDDKCGKYFELASELKALHDLKSFKPIDIIISATGTVMSSTKNNFQELFQEKGTSAIDLGESFGWLNGKGVTALTESNGLARTVSWSLSHKKRNLERTIGKRHLQSL